jgi:hypothetical protein
MVLQVLLWLIVKGHILKVRSILRMTLNNKNTTGTGRKALRTDMRKVVEMSATNSNKAG